jgi:hypothetical protein
MDLLIFIATIYHLLDNLYLNKNYRIVINNLFASKIKNLLFKNILFIDYISKFLKAAVRFYFIRAFREIILISFYALSLKLHYDKIKY